MQDHHHQQPTPAPQIDESPRSATREGQSWEILHGMLYLLIAYGLLLLPILIRSLQSSMSGSSPKSEGTEASSSFVIAWLTPQILGTCVVLLSVVLAVISFKKVTLAMKCCEGQLLRGSISKTPLVKWTPARHAFAQRSLSVSLSMFYVVTFAVMLTALLFGVGRLPISGQHLAQPLTFSDDQILRELSDRIKLVQSLLFSTTLSLVGACFYIANRLRQHGGGASSRSNGIDEDEPFIFAVFWSGLWFRLGQAILYTFAVFIYVWATTNISSPDSAQSKSALPLAFDFRTMPLIGLFLGMFVRASEALVLGLAERIFEMIRNIVGPSTHAKSLNPEPQAGSQVPNTPKPENPVNAENSNEKNQSAETGL